MDEIVVLTTADAAEAAHRIATSLVNAGEAACVNIIPGIRSIYRWQGRVCDEAEVLLLIKTTRGFFEAVRSRIRALHSYEVPEIIALPLAAGDAAYLNWIGAQLGRSAGNP